MVISEMLLIVCLLTLLVASLLALARICLLVATVQGESMAPTLQSGERVLAWRLWPTLRLREGQIILVAQEMGPQVAPYIKRIIALRGEICTLSPRSGMETNEQTSGGLEEKTWHIPPGYVFVCGDNQENSIDSRTWGPLPRQRIQGIVLIKLPRQRLSPTTNHVESLPQQGPQHGELAPSFSAQTINGEYFTQHTYRGQAIMLIFIGTDYVSRKNMPIYQTFCTDLSDIGIRSIFVCNAHQEEAKAFSAEMQITQPLLIAPRKQNPFFKDYMMDIAPTYCLIDEESIVRAAGLASQLLFSNGENVARYMGFKTRFTPKNAPSTLVPDHIGRQ
jgi:signal peptidase I